MCASDRMLLVGCGVLQREIRWLIEKNDWPLDTCFLDSALHAELGLLSANLTGALEKNRERELIVFYGCCHPLMDEILERFGAIRTEGQNCADILLGNQRFAKELADGAFFLLEEWARRWDDIIASTFGNARVEIVREIFHEDRTHLLCVRTPCSDNFVAEAESAGRLVDLPVRWTDVTLDDLEAALRQAIVQRAG